MEISNCLSLFPAHSNDYSPCLPEHMNAQPDYIVATCVATCPRSHQCNVNGSELCQTRLFSDLYCSLSLFLCNPLYFPLSFQKFKPVFAPEGSPCLLTCTPRNRECFQRFVIRCDVSLGYPIRSLLFLEVFLS